MALAVVSGHVEGAQGARRGGPDGKQGGCGEQNKGAINDTAGRAACPGRRPGGPCRLASTRSGRVRRVGWALPVLPGRDGFLHPVSEGVLSAVHAPGSIKSPGTTFLVKAAGPSQEHTEARTFGSPVLVTLVLADRGRSPQDILCLWLGTATVHKAWPPRADRAHCWPWAWHAAGRPVGRRPLHVPSE